MRIHRMGQTGLKVSEICLGTMTFGAQCTEEVSRSIMDRAFEGGVTFFDTADAYPLPTKLDTVGRTEEIIGRWLTDRALRGRITLATKCRLPMGPDPNDSGLSRKHVLRAIDASLARLQTDHVDLFQVHAPDDETPIEETLQALDEIVRAGKALYVGCSNFAGWQIGAALRASERLRLVRFDCVQPRYNLLYREIETELLPLCQAEGLGVICYNPLAGGVLTGKYRPGQEPVAGTRFALHGAGELYRRRYWHEAALRAAEELQDYCTARGKELAVVALAWVLTRPGITSAIVGATRAEQLDLTLRAAGQELDQDEQEACDAAWYSLPRQAVVPGYR